jgi:hypothetical protein
MLAYLSCANTPNEKVIISPYIVILENSSGLYPNDVITAVRGAVGLFPHAHSRQPGPVTCMLRVRRPRFGRLCRAAA